MIETCSSWFVRFRGKHYIDLIGLAGHNDWGNEIYTIYIVENDVGGVGDIGMFLDFFGTQPESFLKNGLKLLFLQMMNELVKIKHCLLRENTGIRTTHCRDISRITALDVIRYTILIVYRHNINV